MVRTRSILTADTDPLVAARWHPLPTRPNGPRMRGDYEWSLGIVSTASLARRGYHGDRTFNFISRTDAGAFAGSGAILTFCERDREGHWLLEIYGKNLTNEAGSHC